MEREVIVSFQNVDFSYNSVPVLEGVTFAIYDRSFISIVGPNAGGKTTLLKLMLGLLEPSRGTIEIFRMPPDRARSLIGYMPQHVQFDPSFPVTVLDVVLMGRLGNGARFGPYRKKAGPYALRRCEDWECTMLGSIPSGHCQGDNVRGCLSRGRWQRSRNCFCLTSRPPMWTWQLRQSFLNC